VALYRHALFALSVLGAAALVAASVATASDATLQAGLAKWSQRIALDARGVAASAAQRHPRRMTQRARKFRADALSAKRALAAVRPSSVRGRRAKALALTAFRDYAVVGRQWTMSGRARLRGQKAEALAHAGVARQFATRANRLLVKAGRLLR
jgi:hypothetical protein